MKKTKFLYGTAILATSSLIVRMVSLSYDITLSRMIGAKAIGLFYMISPILMMFLMVTTAGIPTAVSRLVAKAKSKNNYYGALMIIHTAISLTLIISIVLVLIVIFFSRYISLNMYKNNEILSLIYFIIPAIPILSLTSIFRGYLYGLNKMLKASFSEIIEHVGRFSIVMLIFYYVQPISPYTACKIAILGVCIGEFFDLIYLFLIYKNESNKVGCPLYNKTNIKSILVSIISVAAPLTILGFINVASHSLSAILIPQKLIEAGVSQSEAIKAFGRIMGMAMPLVYLPFIITSAMVINIIPNISKQFQSKDYKDIKSDIKLSIRATFLVTLPIMAIYIFFSKPLSILLYNDVLAERSIRVMAWGMLFLSVQHIFSGILYGMGKQTRATINRVIGIGFQVLCIVFLINNPNYGISGYFIGFIASPIIVCMLDLTVLHKYLCTSITEFLFLSKLLLATIITMVLSLLYFNYSFDSGLSNNGTMILTILIFVFCYIGFLILFKANPLRD